MTLHLYDTLRRAKVPFRPRHPERVTLYVCGPTVYSFAHIGNARPVVVFDVLFRLLRRLYGEDHVVYARNVTDVDDKINQKAKAEGSSIGAVADRFLAIYQSDMAALGALTPTLQPRATHHVEAMIDQTMRLIERGFAYVAEGHVLFRVKAFDDYGALSGRSLEDMRAGARVEVAPYKEEPADFVLWKPADPGDPGWDSPWSRGRPGWHIECSAMIEQELGLPIDIHGGGHDLIFPHHENELAQARGATGADALAEIWMHNGFLDLDGSKMSKSLGNGLQVHDLLQDRPGEVLRWALLKGHYRSPLEWTDSLLDQSRRELDYLYGVLRRAGPSQTPPSREPLGLEPLLDDLNTPAAMGRLHALAHEVEQGGSGAGEALSAMGGLAAVLGVLQQDPETWFQGGVDPTSLARIQTLISERDEARRARNFAEADRLRAELDALGVVVMDAPGGASWRLKE